MTEAMKLDVVEHVRAFIDGRTSALELEGWLDSVSEEVHASGDPALQRLMGRAFTLFAERSRGDRDLSSVKAELRELVT